LNENQKGNHFPGCFHLGRKDRLAINLRSIFAQKEDSFHPQTYILPQDLKLLKKAWIQTPEKDRLMILKPPASARGDLIKFSLWLLFIYLLIILLTHM